MKIYYLTYQDFPANTANSQQTISTCKELSRKDIEVKLLFPLRSFESNDSFDQIKSHYQIEGVKFQTKGLPHKRNFESKYFKRLNFLISHISWSFSSVKLVSKNYEDPFCFITRSEWVFYFLCKKNLYTIFECHKLTYLRKLILKNIIKNSNAKILFTNQELKNSLNINQKYKNRLIVQNNGYDNDFFYSLENKDKKTVIYSGSLQRLGRDRNLEFIFDAFNDPRLSTFQLKVFGGTEKEVKYFKQQYSTAKNISFFGYVTKKVLSEYLAKSEIAILTSGRDNFSMFYTDPIKYYEYSASGLKIVATDFPSHKSLKKYGNMLFFRDQDSESFIKSILEIHKNNLDKDFEKLIPSTTQRINNLLKFIN